MKQCRICEWVFTFQDRIPEDGLCSTCHVNLCQESPGRCNRCTDLINNMINFLQYGEDEDGI